MRIEEITIKKLSSATDKDLLVLKLRFTQLWDKNFLNNDIAIVGSLNRNTFLKHYKTLLTEMNSRKIEKATSAIDKALFRKAMTAREYGLDVSDLNDMLLIQDCVIISAVEANTEKAAVIIKKWIEEFSDADPDAPIVKAALIDAAYIPLYDLVLKAKPSTEIVEVSKPYPNEHSARLQDPDKFDDKSFRRTKGGTVHSKKVPATISVIWGKLEGKPDSVVPQALRFPIKDWTVVKAKKWLADNEVKFILFETATKKTKKMWTSKYVKALPDEAFLYIQKLQLGDAEPQKVRHFAYVDIEGKIDTARLDCILADLAKSKLSDKIKKEVQSRAATILEDISEGKIFEKFISVYPLDKADKEEHIVCGIVYEPDVEDAQGDKANEIEIRKAAYQFMEKVQKFKVMHKGKKVSIHILESYIAPVDFVAANQSIKKGSWVLAVRVLDKKIWKAIKDGTLTGFSMAGYAKATA